MRNEDKGVGVTPASRTAVPRQQLVVNPEGLQETRRAYCEPKLDININISIDDVEDIPHA